MLAPALNQREAPSSDVSAMRAPEHLTQRETPAKVFDRFIESVTREVHDELWHGKREKPSVRSPLRISRTNIAPDDCPRRRPTTRAVPRVRSLHMKHRPADRPPFSSTVPRRYRALGARRAGAARGRC